MDIEGTYTLQASPEVVWQCLSDQQILQRTIPGVVQLEQVDAQHYTLSLSVKQVPLRGTYRGQISITEKQAPYHCHIVIEGDGGQDTISGYGVIHLNERNAATVVVYKGSLTIGKPGTLLSPRLTRGATKLIVQQFFTAVADQLRSKVYAASINGEVQSASAATESMDEEIVILSSASMPQPSTPSFIERVVHLTGLGASDPLEEAKWVQRIRRMSIASGLLFLVWVGTRLPRRG